MYVKRVVHLNLSYPIENLSFEKLANVKLIYVDFDFRLRRPEFLIV